MKEYPDEWLPYSKVPKGLRVAFKRRNATQRKGEKEQDTLSVETSVEVNAMTQQNEVAVFIFMYHECNCLTNIGYLLMFCVVRMQNANRCHNHLLKNLEKESRW